MSEESEKMLFLSILFNDVAALMRYFVDNEKEMRHLNRWLNNKLATEDRDVDYDDTVAKVTAIMQRMQDLGSKAEQKVRMLQMGDFLDELFGGIASSHVHVVFAGGQNRENFANSESTESDEEGDSDSGGELK